MCEGAVCGCAALLCANPVRQSVHDVPTYHLVVPMATHLVVHDAALATEDPSPELLLQKPAGRRESLISGHMWGHILSQVGFCLVFDRLNVGHLGICSIYV